MIIEINLKENRQVDYKNNIIGKTFENDITTLRFELIEEMKDKSFYIDFEKGNGDKIVTPRQEIYEEEGKFYVDYVVPNSLLDIKGQLKAEVVLKQDDEVYKSYFMYFEVLESINAINEAPEKYPDLISKIDVIETDGDGTKYLADDGTYKEVQGGGSAEEVDPTVPNYVKNITENDINNWNSKSNFSGDYGDLNNKPYIPIKTSDLENDSNFSTFSGSYNDLKDVPTIPTSTSQLINDSDFVLMNEMNEAISNAIGIALEGEY